MSKLKMKTTATLLIAIFMISAFTVAIPVSAAGDVWVPIQYSTIQEAIGAVDTGGTVHVTSGAYTENLLIEKALTLQGSGSGVVTVTGSVRIKASDVVVDGFRIEGTVYVDDSTLAITGATISNNYITGASYGIRVGTSSNNEISQLTIEYNEIVFNDAKGICFWKVDWQAGNLHHVYITGNTISDNAGTGISTYGAGPYFIVDNIVERNEGNGISLKYDIGDYVAGNIVTDNDAMGINMHQVTDALVENNDVSGHTNPLVVTGFWPGDPIEVGPGSGIYLHEASTGNTIQLNDIHGNKIGVLIARETEGLPTGNHINYNNILDNEVFGVQNVVPELVDATLNWWGHANGPSGDDGRKNPSGKVIGRGDAVSEAYWDPYLPQPVFHTPHDPVPSGLLE